MRWERVERETNDFMELNKVVIPREVTLLGALVVLAATVGECIIRDSTSKPCN